MGLDRIAGQQMAVDAEDMRLILRDLWGDLREQVRVLLETALYIFLRFFLVGVAFLVLAVKLVGGIGVFSFLGSVKRDAPRDRP